MRTPRPIAAATTPVAPVAWTDPPARSGVPETTGAIRTSARAGGSGSAVPSAIPAPQLAAALPPAAAPALRLPEEIASPTGVPRKAVAVHRPKGSERNLRRMARLRHAALARTAQAERTVVSAPAPQPAQAQPEASSRIDPIGDIIRGLGFGRDG
ncbi:hypothetical protein ACRAWG_08185 [Methylobacterium sp. P31]